MRRYSTVALDALSDLLEGRGELLPLDVEDDDEEYYAFNCTRLSDALDGQRSEFAYFPDGGILDIDHREASLVTACSMTGSVTP